MSDYATLLAKRAELDLEIEQAREAAIEDAFKRIDEILLENDISKQDFEEHFHRSRKKSSLVGKAVAAKYADKNGHNWSGRGQRPVWMREALDSNPKLKLDDFLIK